MQDEHDDIQPQSFDTSVAIIGMTGRFPGADNIEQFWQNLCDGVEGISTFSDEEILAAGVSPEEAAHPLYVKRGGVLANAELFDSSFFGIYPREADIMDPQQRIFLETAWEALERAGYNPESYPGAIGVFAGMGLNTYLLFNLLQNRSVRETVLPYLLGIANDKDYLATRVAYKLNLRGPSVTLQTACSTSLVATHFACQSLLNYGCDIALAGGITVRLPQKGGYLYQEGGIVSPDGYCRAFDAKANGTVSGNGVGIVVLKRLSDALADGDTVHAVIKATAINNDGSQKVGYTAPSVAGQQEVIAMAHDLAEVSPDTITYVEAHGTGTALGDPIEIAALSEVFRRGTNRTQFCAIGSVKTNVGHLDAAAGVASLIKTALALEHRVIPPSLHFEKPNPNIDFAHSPFYVNTRLAPWPAGQNAPRRAGVSSFGIGGTNVHAVLEEAPPAEPSGASRPWQLLLLSARTPTALDAAAQNLAAFLERHPEVNLADAAYTLKVGRKSFDQRRMVVCRNAGEALAALTGQEGPNQLARSGAPQSAHPSVVFMFSGQGAQYVNMTRGLYENEPVYREHVDRCCDLLQPHLRLDLRSLLFPAPEHVEEAAERLKQTAITQPALFVVEYSLAQLWMSWGVQPEAMIGHSVGEYVAACLAGVFTLEDALALVAERGRLMQSLPAGAMLSVPLAEADLAPYLQSHPDLSLATINGPSLAVISGPSQAVDDLERRLAAEGVATRRLHTSHAFHSAMMDPILGPFVDAQRRRPRAAPQIPFISNVTGTWITAQQATDPGYWATHLRQAVRFADGVATLATDTSRVFLEVGPGRTLASLVKSHPAARGRPVVASTRHPHDEQDDQAALLDALGQLWLAGVAPDWAGFYAGEFRRRTALPTYPFERQYHWIEPDAHFFDTAAPASRQIVKRPDIAQWFYLPSWRRAGQAGQPSATSEARQAEHWLLFGNGDPFSHQVAQRLAEHGQTVTVVQPGKRFGRLGNAQDTYTLDPHSRADYRALLEEVAAKAGPPRRIVHLWSARGQESSFAEAQALGFTSLVYLAPTLAALPTPAEAAGAALRIDVVTAGVQEVTGDETLAPERATVLGPCLVIPQEYPSIACHAVDVALDSLAGGRYDRLAEQVVAQLLAAPGEAVSALRGSHRWVPSFEPVGTADSAEGRLRHQGVYLITGGLGRIGFVLAEHLAQAAQARLVLLDRTGLPPQDAWEAWLASHPESDPTSQKIHKLRTLHSHGAETLVIQADVADRRQMAQAVQSAVERFGALHGVVHAAGLVGEASLKPIEELGPADWDQQFQPKALGLQVLAEVLQPFELDFVLLQSSLASILGGLGMAAYAAANQYMDAFIRRMHLEGQRRAWISVNWDGWQAPNAAGAAAASITQLAITPEEGVRAFRRALGLLGLPQVAISTGDLPARLAQYVERQPAQTTVAGPATPAAGPTAAHSRPALRSAYAPAQDDLEREIVALWEGILGIQPIGVNDDFFELGGHSLLATQIVSRLRDTYHVDLPLRNLFESPTVAGLAELIRRASAAPEEALERIQPIAREGELPLSFGQQRLWFLDQLEPGSPLYNNFAALRLEGPVSVAAFRWALHEMVRRHEVLRTVFHSRDGQAVQTILPPPAPISGTEAADHPSIDLPVTDLRHGTDGDARQAELMRLAAQEARQPFDLTTGPLLRARIVQVADEERVLFFTMHHIVSDGWSVGVLIREVITLYNAFLAGAEASPLPPMPIQYVDWAAWQRGWLAGEIKEQQLAYWRAQLADAPTLELATDRPRPPVQTANGANEWFTVPKTVYEQLEALCRREGVTLFMALVAGLQTLLHRYSGQDDLTLGTPIANRTRPETEGLIGFLLNTLVLRTDLSGDPTFRELMQRVREVSLSAYANQDLPFEMLVEELQPQRDMSRSPFFQVMFDLQTAPLAEMSLPGVTLRPLPMDPGTAKFDLAWSLTYDEQGLGGYLNYNTDLFDHQTIVRMLGHFTTLLESIVADPDRRLSQLPLMGDDERQQVLVGWNATDTGALETRTAAQMFEAQALARPAHTAVALDGGPSLSYAELNRRANALAQRLIGLGVGPDRLVALQVERSLDMVVAILAVLKAGGAFVPVDAAAPVERLAFILEDTQAQVLVTQQSLRPPAGAAPSVTVVCLDGGETPAEQPAAGPQVSVLPHAPAYIIYTSGSTGVPKGVVISHGALAQHLHDVSVHFGLTPQDRVLQFAAYTFDQGLEQILATLTSGATLVLRGQDVWPASEFPQVVARHGLSVINLPPAYWNQVILEWSASAAPAEPLRLIIVGGDALAPESLHAWQQSPARRARLLNAYGPTEATITATTFEVTPDFLSKDWQRPVPIGRPLAHRRAYVLDRSGNPAPVGVPGELYLGGAGLALGYLNRPDLTAERFIPSPFVEKTGPVLETGPVWDRLYRTGDLARWLPGGHLEFLGRVDQQVKIRGFRIELGEVEAVLAQHPAVQDVVVVARSEDRAASGGWSTADKRLVAYVIPAGGAAPTAADLRSFVERKLPAYMTPSAFVFLPAFPLTASGKVNRRALPAPDAASLRSQAETVYVAPRTPTEADLAAVWAAVLGVERVGIYDNFFDLGGHSLLATQILARIKADYPVELPLRRLFETPTVAGLAEQIDQSLLAQQDEEELARLLQELESMSEDEAKGLLAV